MSTRSSQGGQQGQGPEMPTLKRYDVKQLLKTISIFNRQLIIITDYNNSKRLNRGRDQKVARALLYKSRRLMSFQGSTLAWTFTKVHSDQIQ
jgi:hypothetical protein